MEEKINSSLYPGAHIKYSFDLPGITFKPFSCSIDNPPIKEVIFEKPESESQLNKKCWMTFNFGPVESLEEAEKRSDPLKEELLDILSLELSTKVGKAKLIERNLIPRPGDGGILHIFLPRPVLFITGHSEDRKLCTEEITNIQDIFSSKTYSKNTIPLRLFRDVLLLDDEIARFIMLYSIIDIITSKGSKSNQKEIDKSIMQVEPLTVRTKSPYTGVLETCYTRLRNEVNHRDKDVEATISGICSRLYDFQRIVQEIVKSTSCDKKVVK